MLLFSFLFAFHCLPYWNDCERDSAIFLVLKPSSDLYVRVHFICFKCVWFGLPEHRIVPFISCYEVSAWFLGMGF